MTIVMPMAGRSQRFKDAGYGRSKYYEIFHQQCMYRHVMKCLPEANQIIFVCLEEDRDLMRADGMATLPREQVLFIPEVTDGPASTVLKTKGWIDPEEELLVVHADQILDWSPAHFLSSIRREWEYKSLISGAIPIVRKSVDDWGYVDVDLDSGLIVRVSEKVRTGEDVICGVYWFKSAEIAFDAMEGVQRECKADGNENYVGTAYNWMIARGYQVLPYYVFKK